MSVSLCCCNQASTTIEARFGIAALYLHGFWPGELLISTIPRLGRQWPSADRRIFRRVDQICTWQFFDNPTLTATAFREHNTFTGAISQAGNNPAGIPFYPADGHSASGLGLPPSDYYAGIPITNIRNFGFDITLIDTVEESTSIRADGIDYRRVNHYHGLFGSEQTGYSEGDKFITVTAGYTVSKEWKKDEAIGYLEQLLDAVDLSQLPATDFAINPTGNSVGVKSSGGVAFFADPNGGIQVVSGARTYPGPLTYLDGRFYGVGAGLVYPTGITGRAHYVDPNFAPFGPSIFAGATFNPADEEFDAIRGNTQRSVLAVKSKLESRGMYERLTDSPMLEKMGNDRCALPDGGQFPVLLGCRPVDFAAQPAVRHAHDWSELKGQPTFLQLDLQPC